MKPLKVSILLVFLCFSVISLVPINEVKADNELTVFRPFYEGYGEGTIEVVHNTNLTSITREWNFIGWDISEWFIKIRFCVPKLWVTLGGGSHVDPAFYVIIYVSTDNGTTYPYELDYEVGYLIYTMEHQYAGWCYNDWIHNMEYPVNEKPEGLNVSDIFLPTTRIKIQLFRTWYSLYEFYLGNAFWDSTQKPVPPSDFIDDYSDPPNWAYVQYYIQFYVSYTEQTIEYKGKTFDFPYSETKEKLKKSADMILNCMHPSGCVNEVVITDIPFGKHSWVVLYSSELAMMNLIDLCSIFPDEASHYLVATKRFIAYLWSKQRNNGSFPFILTDGDQHCWYNETDNRWYGYDSIDSFSACAISLMRKYYDATGDLDFINNRWDNIHSCQDFIYDLIDFDVWLPVDGYHFNGTHYNKSEWNWLHDVCEAYQGLKDLSYLYSERGNDTDATYWDNMAESIAAATREKMWNETLGRYVGMYNIITGEQNPILVYNIITPIIYGMETNITRASLTIDVYVSWGILTGRYYNVKWAEDYDVRNEYSTMSGMIYSSFYCLINDFNYTTTWMKDKFLEIGKFLFLNPIYPAGNLQNNDGWLDWVNLVNYTYAPEYARLVETSAWLIDGMLKLPNMTELFTYNAAELSAINDTLCQEEIFWNKQYQKFKKETGFDCFESIGYYKWVQWLKANGTYVQWYDYMFLKFLFEHGYLGDEPWWEDDIPPDWIEIVYVQRIPNYVPLFCGVFGLICIMFTPYYVIKKFKEGEYSTGIGYGMLIFIIAIGLIIFWLWG